VEKHISAEGELRYRVISDTNTPEVDHRLAEIHLAKIGKLDRGEQLIDDCPPLRRTIKPRKTSFHSTSLTALTFLSQKAKTLCQRSWRGVPP